MGRSGGGGGTAFNDEPLFAPGSRVARVTIRTGTLVDSVQMTHENRSGNLVDLPHHGGFGGMEQSIDLAANEHIVQIDGRYGNVVDSISIRTSNGRVLSGGGGPVTYQY